MTEIGREEAAQLLAEIRRKLKLPVAAKPMPKPLRERRVTDHERAMQLVTDAMLESLKRCAELEQDR